MTPPTVPSMTLSDPEIVEMAFALPRWQAEAFAKAASQMGMTAGQMLRTIIGASLSGLHPQGS